MRSTALAVATLLAATTLSACGDAEPDASGSTASDSVTVSDARGETEVPLAPERIVTFDIGVMDTIVELGGEVAGVPKAFVPDFLAPHAGDEVTDVGTLFEPDYEAVNELDPDLIIVGGRSAEAYDDLSEIAPTLDLTLDQGSFLDSFREQTETLATVLGAEDAAQDALEALDEKVERTSEQVSDAGSGLILLTTGGEVAAYGAGSRFGNVIHDLLGVAPADEDIESETHGEAVSFEYVADTDPDWLFVVDRDTAIGETEGGSAQEVLDNELVASTTAWQEAQVVYLDPVRWYIVGSGLSTVDAMVTQIQESVR